MEQLELGGLGGSALLITFRKDDRLGQGKEDVGVFFESWGPRDAVAVGGVGLWLVRVQSSWGAMRGRMGRGRHMRDRGVIYRSKRTYMSIILV